MSRISIALALCVTLCTAGCWPESKSSSVDVSGGGDASGEVGQAAGTDTGPSPDAGPSPDSSSPPDSGTAPDAAVFLDTGPDDPDAAWPDATAVDATAVDGSAADVSDPDAADTALTDAASADASQATGPPDAVPGDGEPTDGGDGGASSSQDASASDGAAFDAGPADASAADAGPKDAGPADAGPKDAGPTQVSACLIAAQCPSSGNPCVLPLCVQNVCVQTVVDFFPCDDGDPCTAGDTCVVGQCVGSAGLGAKGTCGCKSDTDCAAKGDSDPCNGVLRCDNGTCALKPGTVVACGDDGDPCTVQSCDATTGACVHKPVDGWSCSDGNPCTLGDFCAGGACKPGKNSCPCTDDAGCPGSKGAGDKCVQQWACVGGGCTPKQAVPCGDAGPCVDTQCDPKTGACGATPTALPCDDGDVCTVGDVCAKGVCTPGAGMCPCQSQSDCTALDDDDLCTAPLVCSQGHCTTAAAGDVTCDTSGDGPCAKTACLPKTGKCSQTPVPDGQGCDDGNPCTGGELCKGGSCGGGKVLCQCTKDADCAGKSQDLCVGAFACVGGVCKPNPAKKVQCPPPSAGGCLVSACDPKTGGCSAKPTNEGKACGDAEVCLSRACQSGTCVSAPSCPCTTDAECAAKDDGDLCNGTLVCDHSLPKAHCVADPATVPVCVASLPDSCLATVCDPKTGGCVLGAQEDGGPCEDGSSCTTAEFCVSGSCVAGKLKPSCACKADGDCAIYDDGDACTGVWGCVLGPTGGSCGLKPGTVPSCPKGGPGPCLAWACAPQSGTCKALPAPGKCDDGVPCTTDDSCKGGLCVGGKSTCGCLADTDCAATNACLGAAYCDKSGSTWTCKQSPAGATVCDTSGDPPCMKTSCDPATGACKKAPAAKGTACVHSAPCSGLGACDAGICVPPGPCACGSDSDCKDDGNPCNGKPRCVAKGGGTVCETDPATVVTCTHLSETACATWACDPKQGKCVTQPKAKGTPCAGPKCTQSACDGGTCKAVKQLCGCTSHAQCKQAAANKCGGVSYCDFASFPFACKTTGATKVSCDPKLAGPCQTIGCDPATGACKLSPKPQGTPCTDGKLCTKGDSCDAGVCKPGKNTCACKGDADCVAQEDGDLCNGTLYCRKDTHTCAVRPDSVVVCKPDLDGDPCVEPACVAATGQCAPKSANPGKSCDDGDPCTPASSCDKGACVGKSSGCPCGKDADCAAKDDGNPCTGVLTCQSGQCRLKPGSVPDCQGDDDPGCAQHVCDAKTGGCVAKSSDGKACDDGVSCTLHDKCAKGSCTIHANLCYCQPNNILNCWGKLNLFAEDKACYGEAVCVTGTQAATGSLTYTCALLPGSEVLCDNSLDTTCHKNTCQVASGQCAVQAVNQGAICDDGDPCTVNATCKDGACGHDGVNLCKCTKDADCAAHGDGNPCNGSLACDLVTKTCKLDPATTVWCDPFYDTDCLQHVCVPTKGVCELFKKTHIKVESFYKIVGTKPNLTKVKIGEKTSYYTTKQTEVYCDDGAPCTANDKCEGATCAGQMICACAKDADCAKQEDGNLCNGTLRCNAAKGTCELDPATTVSCAASTSACVKSQCVAKTGLCTTEPVTDLAPCDDGNPCTVGEHCAAGKCSAGVQVCKCAKDADCSDDGDLCNGVPYCDAKGACQIDPATVVSCGGPGESACVGWACQPKTGKCALAAIQEGQPCVLDGDPCWASPVCKQGVCTATVYSCCKSDAECAAKPGWQNSCNATGYCDKSLFKPKCAFDPKQKVWCDPLKGDACNDWACKPSTGTCGLKPKASGAACDDGDACTGVGKCEEGKCAPGPSICGCDKHSDCNKSWGADKCKGTSYCAVAPDGKRSCTFNPTSVPFCPAPAPATCKVATCDSATGKCATETAPDSTPCGGGKFCLKGVCG